MGILCEFVFKNQQNKNLVYTYHCAWKNSTHKLSVI